MEPITQTPEQEDADFTAAFAEFSPEEGAAAPVVKTPEELAAEAAAATPAVKTPEEIAAAEAAKVVAAPAVKTPEEIAAEEAAAKAAGAPDWQSEIDQLKSNLAAERAAREAAAEAARAAPAKVVEEMPLYTADEQAVLTRYQEDWPDVSKAEALTRRAEYKDLVGYIFQQVRAELAPLQDFVSTQAPRTQYSEITKLVPDYDDVRDKALAWVDSQPAYIKAAYKQVTDGGSPEEVADLLNRFKKETNYASPAAPTPSASPAAGAATSTTSAAPAKPAAPALPAAATKAAAKLAVVKTGRTEQESGDSDDDFDGAFAKYAASEDKQNTRR
jgi:hypothetical protein